LNNCRRNSTKRLVYLCDAASDGQSAGVIRPVALADLANRAGYRALVVSSTVSNKSPVRCRSGLKHVNKVSFLKLDGLFVAGNGLRRALNMFYFAVRSTIVLWNIRHKATHNVVLTSSTGTLDALAGFIAKKFLGYRWVLEVRDIWPEAPMQLRPELRSYGFYTLTRRALKCALINADAIVSPLHRLKDFAHQHNITITAPFLHLPNCGYFIKERDSAIAGSISSSAQTVLNTIDDLRSLGRPIVAYFGSMNTANGIDRLFSLFASMPENLASFLFVGNGAFLQNLSALAATKNCIRVCAAVSREECKVLMGLVDILAFGIPALPVYRFGLSPIKLSEYLHAGKPVFYWGAPFEQSDDADDLQAIVAVSSEERCCAAAALKELVTEPLAKRTIRGSSARNLAEKRYQYSAYEAAFCSLLDGTPHKNTATTHKDVSDVAENA